MKTCGNKDCPNPEQPSDDAHYYRDEKAADKRSSWCIICQKARYESKNKGKVDLSDFMEDGLGRLVHIDQVREIDKLRDELVRSLVARAVELQREMINFKAIAMDEIDAFVDQSAREYDVQMGGRKGNLTLYSFDMNYMIKIQISEYLVFDERLQVAKKLIDECLTTWSETGPTELRTVVNDTFAVNQEGKINTRRVLELRRRKIDNEKWQKAMKAISESIQVAGSKSYMRIYKRIEQTKAWQVISLDLAAL